MRLALILENENFQLYHGTDSENFNGPIRLNERDPGWFGSGFYLTADIDYAKRWGKNIFKFSVPLGKFANIRIIGNYDKIDFGEAEFANQKAGGSIGWIEDEAAWAKVFNEVLRKKGYDGIRVHCDQRNDLEVVVFDPSKMSILGKYSETIDH